MKTITFEGICNITKIYTTYEEYSADIDLMLDNSYDTASNHYDADGNLVVTYERIAN